MSPLEDNLLLNKYIPAQSDLKKLWSLRVHLTDHQHIAGFETTIHSGPVDD